MTVSIIERLSTTLTDLTLPKLYRDPIMNNGSKFLFDFCNPYCNPNPDAALTASMTFNNLLDAGPAATIVGGVGLANAAGKAGVTFSGGQGSTNINLGTAYDLHATNDEFILIYWDKESASGYNSGGYIPGPYLSLTSDANHAQWYFDYGADGKTIRASVGTSSGSGGVSVPAASGLGQGAPRQIALHWKSTGLLELYVNGALQGSSLSAPTTLPNAATDSIVFPNYYVGTLYRLYQEDLTVSGLSAASQILADYNSNAGRFI